MVLARQEPAPFVLAGRVDALDPPLRTLRIGREDFTVAPEVSLDGLTVGARVVLSGRRDPETGRGRVQHIVPSVHGRVTNRSSARRPSRGSGGHRGTTRCARARSSTGASRLRSDWRRRAGFPSGGVREGRARGTQQRAAEREGRGARHPLIRRTWRRALRRVHPAQTAPAALRGPLPSVSMQRQCHGFLGRLAELACGLAGLFVAGSLGGRDNPSRRRRGVAREPFRGGPTPPAGRARPPRLRERPRRSR